MMAMAGTAKKRDGRGSGTRRSVVLRPSPGPRKQPGISTIWGMREGDAPGDRRRDQGSVMAMRARAMLNRKEIKEEGDALMAETGKGNVKKGRRSVLV